MEFGSALRSLVRGEWSSRARGAAAFIRTIPGRLTDQEVSHAFQLVLDRTPSGDEFTHFRTLNRIQRLGNLLRSEEFILKRSSSLPDVVSTSVEDLSVFRQFPRFMGPPSPGFVTDFLGSRTDVRFIRGIEHLSGVVEAYPIPRGNFHGDLVEWLGTLLSVLAAQEHFTVFELGAGWAPWLVASARAAAAQRITRTRLVGVEGSSGHAEMMWQHFENNNIPTQGNLLLHGAIGTSDGVVEFPVTADPAADWGQRPVLSAGEDAKTDYRGLPVALTEKVPVYSLDALLADEASVDLIHIDIQGSEAEVVEAAVEVLGKKVKCLIIGTHGRAIEQKLVDVLTSDGWVLCREHACRLGQSESMGVVCMVDGCQMWRNPRLLR